MNGIRQALTPLALVLGGVLTSLPVHADIFPVTDAHCALMKAQKVIGDDNPLGCERLRVVTFRHHDFDGNDQRAGKVVVLDAVAKNVQVIFDALHARGFMLKGARLMEEYAADDNAAMADNNTSAFNGRKITGGSSWSIHAYGAAIDLNPLQNPFISIDSSGSASIAPAAAARLSVNRLDYRPNKPVLNGKVEEVVGLFADNGFINWGGYWNFPVDYQHFEPGTKAFVMRLANAPAAEAQQLFERYVEDYRRCMTRQADKPQALARKLCAEDLMT